MQTAEKLEIKNQLANITTPLRLPQIRKRAKSIADKMQYLHRQKQKQKQKQKMKLPAIKNPSVKDIKQNRSEVARVNFVEGDIKKQLKNVLRGIDVRSQDADSRGGSQGSNDFDFQSEIKNNREKIRVNRANRGNFNLKPTGNLLTPKQDDIDGYRPKSSRNVPQNIPKQPQNRPKSSAVISTSQKVEQVEPIRQPQNSQQSGKRIRKTSFNVRSNDAKNSQQKSNHLKIPSSKGNLSVRKSAQKPKTQKLTPLNHPKSVAGAENKNIIRPPMPPIIKKDKPTNQAKQLKTQQLRQMKLQLQQKIRKIDAQMQAISISPSASLPKPQKLLRMSTQNWNRFHSANTQRNLLSTSEVEQPAQKEFDHQLEKISRLQNKGQEILDQYVQNRMLLMDLNIYKGQEKILDEVYIGNEK